MKYIYLVWSKLVAGLLKERYNPLFSQLTTASHHYTTSFYMAIVDIHAVARKQLFITSLIMLDSTKHGWPWTI